MKLQNPGITDGELIIMRLVDQINLQDKMVRNIRWVKHSFQRRISNKCSFLKEAAINMVLAMFKLFKLLFGYLWKNFFTFQRK